MPITVEQYAKMYERLCRNIGRVLDCKNGNNRGDKQHWHFIPERHDIVIAELEEAKKLIGKDHPTLLDVGCGPGNILDLADALSYSAMGIERNIDLVRIATYSRGWFADYTELVLDRKTTDSDVRRHIQADQKASNRIVWKMDALNFKYYDQFDVVYFYCPFKDSLLQQKLEVLIETHMKKGALYIANLKQGIVYPDGFKKASDYFPIWECTTTLKQRGA